MVGVSGGNFARGLAYAARELDTPALICMPESTPRNYVEATRDYGAAVDLAPAIRQAFARADHYKAQGWNLLHPFDSPHQMAGAGTIGLELLEDLPEVTDVVISIGGGGLIGGITVAIKALKPEARIWGLKRKAQMPWAKRSGRARSCRSRPHRSPKPSARLTLPKTPWRCCSGVSRSTSSSRTRKRLRQVCSCSTRQLNTELAASCPLAAARRLKGVFSQSDHVVLVICGGNNSLDNWMEYRRLFELIRGVVASKLSGAG